MKEVIGDAGIGMIEAVKNYIDPNNIFAAGNLVPSANKQENTESPAEHIRAKL